jgi:hypothetical protein
MPASHAVYKWCTCQECIENGGRTENGAPKGVLIAEHLMAAHLQCTQHAQAEHVALARAAGSAGQDDSMNLVASQLCTLILTDNDPLIAVSARMDVSHTATPVHDPELEQPNIIPPLSIPTLADHLERLTLSDPLLHETSKGAEIGRPRNRNRQTVTDLKVLDNIELHVQWCFRLLSAGNSDNAHRELLLLRKAVEKVKQKAELVVARKESIMLEIDALDTQFNSCKPSARDLPVEFDTGKYCPC